MELYVYKITYILFYVTSEYCISVDMICINEWK